MSRCSRKHQNPSTAQMDSDDSFVENAGSKLCDRTRYFLEVLNETLVNQYTNVAHRLRIRDLPKCLLNPENCKDQHYKNELITLAVENIYFSKALMQGNQPLTFLRVLDLITESDKFVDQNVLTMVLEMILTINDSENNGYNIDDVIERSVLTFKRILSTFPPCWLATLPAYRELVLKPIGKYGLIKDDDETKLDGNILTYLLDLIEMLIQPESLIDENEHDLNNSQLLQDFCLWNAATEQKYQFSKHSRNVKIERVFTVFDLIMDVLEYDLSSWTLRKIRRPDGKMSKIINRPIIAQFLWPDDEVKDVNYRIKMYIKLYFDLISIDSDELMIKSFGRLINLICNIFELAQDHTTADNGITYPFEWKNEHRFGLALHKILKEHHAYSTSFYIKIINLIEMLTLKKILIEKFLFELDKKQIEFKVKSMLNMIIAAEKSSDPVEKNDDTNGEPKEKYPCLKKIKRQPKSALSDQEYLNLIWKGLEVYAELKHLKKCFMNLENQPLMPIYEKPKSKKSKNRLENLRSIKNMNSIVMKKSIEQQLKNAKNDLIPITPPINLENVKLITIDSANIYRSDIKYMYVAMSKSEKFSLDKKMIEKVFGSCGYC